jgi:hypothetical protein
MFVENGGVLFSVICEWFLRRNCLEKGLSAFSSASVAWAVLSAFSA